MHSTSIVENHSKIEYLKVDNNSKTLVVMFHGFGASMHDLFGLSSVIDPNKEYDWIFPNGTLKIDMGAGARAWFPIDSRALEQAMIKGEHRDFSKHYPSELHESLEISQIFLDNIKSDYSKIVLGGFSQGAMLSTHLSLKNSDAVHSLLALSPGYIGRDQLILLLEKSQNFPFLISHGKADPILSYSYAKNLFELLKLGGHEGEFISFDGQHEIPMIVLNKIKTFLTRVLKN